MVDRPLSRVSVRTRSPLSCLRSIVSPVGFFGVVNVAVAIAFLGELLYTRHSSV